MLLKGLNRRDATIARLVGLTLILWSVISSNEPPTLHGRGLVVLVVIGMLVAAWLIWTFRTSALCVMTPDLYVIAGASAVLAVAAPNGAGSAGAFVAAMAAAARVDARRGFMVVGVAVASMSTAAIVYDWSGLGVLAYTGGWIAMAFAGSNIRQMEIRAEQAELLLAQTQRSHEEQLRATRLEEQARIAREIHDVLAHSLAGLTIQLEATTALLDQGAEPETIRDRIERAHALARDGLRETRRAVGALREEASVPVSLALKALVDAYRAEVDVPVQFTLEGDLPLRGELGEAVLRVVQEALTNVRKHAPGASVSVVIAADAEDVSVVIEDRVAAPVAAVAPTELSGSGGGYGLCGMRERAALLGGTLAAGPTDHGWRVELRLPLGGRT
jgi:signal transduction histidine kinase